MNSRLFWPRTVPVKAQYCRSRKAAGVDHHGHEELALPLREAEAGQGVHAGLGDAVVDVVGRVFVRHRNSSMPRGCGPDRPPPPRDPTT